MLVVGVTSSAAAGVCLASVRRLVPVVGLRRNSDASPANAAVMTPAALETIRPPPFLRTARDAALERARNPRCLLAAFHAADAFRPVLPSAQSRARAAPRPTREPRPLWSSERPAPARRPLRMDPPRGVELPPDPGRAERFLVVVPRPNRPARGELGRDPPRGDVPRGDAPPRGEPPRRVAPEYGDGPLLRPRPPEEPPVRPPAAGRAAVAAPGAAARRDPAGAPPERVDAPAARPRPADRPPPPSRPPPTVRDAAVLACWVRRPVLRRPCLLRRRYAT